MMRFWTQVLLGDGESVAEPLGVGMLFIFIFNVNIGIVNYKIYLFI